MRDLGELTRRYQAALEEHRIRAGRGEDLADIETELAFAHDEMELAWLEGLADA